MEDATKASTMDSGRTTTTYINKVIYGTEVLIDLTGDTVVADKLMSGYVAHDKSGAPITGTCDFDVNTQDATSTAAELLSGRQPMYEVQRLPVRCRTKARSTVRSILSTRITQSRWVFTTDQEK